jgi:hypothetical protein
MKRPANYLASTAQPRDTDPKHKAEQREPCEESCNDRMAVKRNRVRRVLNSHQQTNRVRVGCSHRLRLMSNLCRFGYTRECQFTNVRLLGNLVRTQPNAMQGQLIGGDGEVAIA